MVKVEKKEEEDSTVTEKVEEVAEEPVVEEKKKEENVDAPDKKEKPLDLDKFKEEIKEMISENLKVKSKVVKQTKEETKMDKKEIPLCIKEMRESIKTGDMLQYKEAASRYFESHPEIDSQLKSTGIPLRSTMKVKCTNKGWNGLFGKGELRVVSDFETKDTLDTTTNTTTYTQSIVEFADVYLPTIIDTFNNLTNFFGALPKRDHIDGGNYYGWRTKTNQSSGLAVDPDVTTVNKEVVSKYKLRTPIREYRIGVSISDYTLYHSRAAIGDLFMKDVEAKMRDLMKDINKDLFTENADTAGVNEIIGIPAVSDSAGNTSLYGLTRSTTNRLSPATATDTYAALPGSELTNSSAIRHAVAKVEVEGGARGNLRLVVTPAVRDIIFNLEGTKIRYMNEPNLGFFGAPAHDGIPIIVDPDAKTGTIFVVDFEGEYIVISKAPQLTGLAKVGAAEEAYISVYLAHVYEQPRRIFEYYNVNK